MTDKQIKTLNRQIALLERIRANIEAGAADSVVGREVKQMALESNADCLRILRDRLTLHDKLTTFAGRS